MLSNGFECPTSTNIAYPYMEFVSTTFMENSLQYKSLPFNKASFQE